MGDPSIHWVSVCDPGDPRAEALLAAANNQPGTSVELMDYRVALAGGRPTSRPGCQCVLRLDSPGRASDLYAAIVALGLEQAAQEGAPTATDLGEIASLHRSGAIVCPRQWYLGYSTLLTAIEARLEGFAWRTNSAEDILLCFDKSTCARHLARHRIPVPMNLGSVTSYEQLTAAMRSSGCSRVFLKLNHGSAGSGVLAYRRSSSSEQAWTTVELATSCSGIQLFNRRRVERLCDARRIAAVVDALAPHGAHAEAWVPKAGLHGSTFDLRILLIGGMPTHIVVRQARSPITNLHLGNRRLAAESLREVMSDDAWSSVMETSRAVGKIFPRSFSSVSTSPSRRRCEVTGCSRSTPSAICCAASPTKAGTATRASSIS